MRVLVACEFSGIVRDAFIARGHDAWSCDILSTERPGPHFQEDVRYILENRWDLMIAHPPCDYLANSGARWLYHENGSRNEDRWRKMKRAAEFFRVLLDAPIPCRCIENPIIHKHAAAIIGRRQDQVIQPWQHGHGETKATCLWLEGLPKLEPSNVVEGRYGRCWREAPGPNRKKNRARTYPGIAAAMAEQWG